MQAMRVGLKGRGLRRCRPDIINTKKKIEITKGSLRGEEKGKRVKPWKKKLSNLLPLLGKKDRGTLTGGETAPLVKKI